VSVPRANSEVELGAASSARQCAHTDAAVVPSKPTEGVSTCTTLAYASKVYSMALREPSKHARTREEDGWPMRERASEQTNERRAGDGLDSLRITITISHPLGEASCAHLIDA